MFIGFSQNPFILASFLCCSQEKQDAGSNHFNFFPLWQIWASMCTLQLLHRSSLALKWVEANSSIQTVWFGLGFMLKNNAQKEGLWRYEYCKVWWSCQEFQRWRCSSVIFIQLLWPHLGLQATDFVAQNLWISNSNIWSDFVFTAPLTLKSLGVSVPGFLQLAAFLPLNLHNLLCLVL